MIGGNPYFSKPPYMRVFDVVEFTFARLRENSLWPTEWNMEIIPEIA